MPDPLTVLRSPLKPILDAVEARLATLTVIPASRIRQVARQQKELPHLDGDQDILLRTRGFVADYANHRDRHTCRVVRRLSVILRTRLELDEAGGDELWLGDPKGSLAFEDDVIDALQGYTPSDGDGNALTIEPLYVMSGEDPRASHTDWGEVELLFGLAIQLPLEQRAE